MYDLVGDVHGCFDELMDLLERLAPARTLVFVGDLVDRGPKVRETLDFVRKACAEGRALCVRGNHEDKLLRALKGADVKRSADLESSLAQLASQTPAERAATIAFLESLPHQLALDDGRLVVAHAGLEERLHGKDSKGARAFALFGKTTGRTGADGYPERLDWAADYRGAAAVVYGHTPVERAAWRSETICLDTGCVFGGALTALRWPERVLVSVPARRAYWARKPH
jgi:diadenosine tetraphosphatase ApaH/serine/threonine PP2A family protein phosphatase